MSGSGDLIGQNVIMTWNDHNGAPQVASGVVERVTEDFYVVLDTGARAQIIADGFAITVQ